MTANDSADSATEPRLDRILPFGEFLRELRRRKLALDVRSFVSVERLLGGWEGTDRDELRDALAALLARDEQEVAAIKSAFDDYFPRPVRQQPPGPQWRPIALAAAATAIMLLVVLLLARPKPGPPEQRQPTSTASPITTKIAVPTPVPPRKPDMNRLPPPPLRETTRLASAAAGAAFAITVMLLAVVLRRVWRRRVHASRIGSLAEAAGPFRYKPAAPPPEHLIPRDWIEEFAAIIGRGVEEDEQSDHLDVDESLRLTLADGLYPHLVFEPPPCNQPLLIVEDRGRGMRPWHRKLDAFVDELRRQRVQVEHWIFESDPRFVWRENDRRPIPLHELANATANRSVLLLATGAPIGEILTIDSDTAGVVQRWRLRTCVTPIANPAYWPGNSEAMPMRMWPMTRNGLRGAAWEITPFRDVAAARPELDGPRAVTEGDVERMKRLVALLPNPTLHLVDQLRRRFHPDIPEEVLLFLTAGGALRGDSLRLPEAEVRQLVKEERREAPLRELQVRRYLLEVLHDSEPPEGSVAHSRWQIDRAVQELNVAGIRGGDPAAPLEALAAIATGPLHGEVAAAVEQVPDRKIAPRLQRIVDRTAAVVVQRRPWTLALAAATLVIAALAGLVTFAFWKTRFPEHLGAPIPHDTRAYSITSENGRLVFRRMHSSAPAIVDLYADDVAIGGPFDLGKDAVRIHDLVLTDSWIQLRALQQPEANWAASNSFYVPIPTQDVRTDDRHSVPSTPNNPLELPDASVESAISLPLRVWIPTTTQELADEHEQLAMTLRSDTAAHGVTLVATPSMASPTHTLRLENGGEWELVEKDRSVRRGLNTAEMLAIARNLSPGSLFVEFPPSRELVRTLDLSNVQLSNDRKTADYALVGRYLGEDHLVFAWMRTGRSDRKRAFPSEVAIGDLQRLTRIFAWTALESPLSFHFPYHLVIRDTTTGRISRVLIGGRRYRLVLRTTSASRVSGRFVYIFLIDSSGASMLLYPRSPTTENRLPLSQTPPPTEIALSEFVGSPPYGIDTFFLLATDEPLPNPWVLEWGAIAVRSSVHTLAPLPEGLALTSARVIGSPSPAESTAGTFWWIEKSRCESVAP